MQQHTTTTHDPGPARRDHQAGPDATRETLARIERSVALLTDQVVWLAERQRRQAELFEEAMPILKEVMDAATERLHDYEQRGWFAKGKALLRVVEQVADGFTVEDVEQLGDSVVGILDTVRRVTQDDVLAVANDATDALTSAADAKPVSVFGMLKASRDAEVQRGVAVMLEMLRHVGRSSQGAARARRLAPRVARLERTAPRRSAPRPGPRAAAAPAPAPEPACELDTPAASVELTVPGVALTPEGYLANPEAWSREVATRIAAAIGVPELTDEHWAVIEYARAQYLEHGASPNIRKITKGSGVSTRRLYALWPTAPGLATARCAGIPKPAGCI